MPNIPPLVTPVEKKDSNKKVVVEPAKSVTWIGKIKEKFKPRKFFNLKITSLWTDDVSEFFRVTYMPTPSMKEMGACSYWVIVNLKTGNYEKIKEVGFVKENKDK